MAERTLTDRKPEATDDEQRNRVIANDVRVSVWAIAIGVIPVGIVLWPWLNSS